MSQDQEEEKPRQVKAPSNGEEEKDGEKAFDEDDGDETRFSPCVETSEEVYHSLRGTPNSTDTIEEVQELAQNFTTPRSIEEIFK
ncbi:hypothetical protein CSUI_007359, partial [Cystoisospora suis]